MMRFVSLFLALALLLPLHAWQKYSGPRPPKPDIPYLLHASTLVETEVKEAKDEQRKDENAAVIDGAASPVRTPLPEPIFLFLSEKISPDKLEMYKLEVKSGKREVAFPAAGKRKKDGPRPIHISTSKVDGSLYRIEASEVLEQGEYCLSPSGVNQVFCFQVY